MTHIDVVCTNPPGGPDDPPATFVELEDDQRRSVSVGEWLQRDDGYWVLLADCHPDRLYVLPLVMGYGGLRVGEALGLRPADVDVWPGAVEKAGLVPPPLRRHDLRHSAVAMWISAGVDPKTIAEWAGHTSTRVVFDRYGHLRPHDSERFVAKLSAMADEAQRKASQRGQVRKLRDVE